MDQKAPLHIVSEMPDYGVTFIDSIKADFMEFNSSMVAVIAPAERNGLFVT